MSFKNRNALSSRTASVVVEAVVALALLATALIALGKLATTSTAVRQQSDAQLAATLVAENTLERLSAIAFDDATDQTPKIANTMRESSGYDVVAKTDSFRVGEQESMHVTVQVRSGDLVAVTLHDWRVRPAANSESEDENE